MSAGKLITEGQKGKNFPFQHNLLLALGSIINNTQGLVPPGGGLATEATLQSVLGELLKDSDFELKCVRDTATDVVYIMRVYRQETDGSIVIDYIDATGSVVVPPNPGNLVVCNPNAVLELIYTQLQTLTAAVVETPSHENVVGPVGGVSGTISAGAIEISVENSGSGDVTVAGTTLEAGKSIGWKVSSKHNATLAAVDYDVPEGESIKIVKTV